MQAKGKKTAGSTGLGDAEDGAVAVAITNIVVFGGSADLGGRWRLGGPLHKGSIQHQHFWNKAIFF